jgi:hypothetical protein
MRLFAGKESAPANPSTAKYFIKSGHDRISIGGLAVAMPEAGK